MKTLAWSLLVSLCVPLTGATQQRPPDTVFLEQLTWDELRNMIMAGKTSVIIATAGTEQKGPHMVIGEHKFALEYTADKIARALGNAVVAPIITYVPEGSWDPPDGHMRMPGTITLPEDRFQLLLENTARSLKAGGFTDIILIGDSGGNQTGMQAVATKLNTLWAGTPARAHFIGDYYTKAQAEGRRWLIDSVKVSTEQIGSHAGIMDTAELMFINDSYIRMNLRAPNGGSPGSGVSGDPTKATKAIGERLLRIKIDNAIAQIKASMAAPRGGQQ